MDAEARSLTIEDVLALERLEGMYAAIADLSPCGSTLALVVTAGCAERIATTLPFLLGMDLGRLHLIDLASGAVRRVQTEPGTGLASPVWSPDGRHVAVAVASAESLCVGVVEVDSLVVRISHERQLCIEPQRQPAFRWLDARTLACHLLPAGRQSLGLEITLHARRMAPSVWARALNNRLVTADPLQIRAGIESGAESVWLDIPSLQIRTATAAEQTPVDRTQATLHAAERVLVETQGLKVDARRDGLTTQLRLHRSGQMPRCLLELNSHLRDVRLGQVLDLDYCLADGRKASVRCVLPTEHRPGERRPAVMFVYPRLRRGPDSNAHRYVEGPGFIYNAQLFAAQGYVVLEPALPFDPERDGELIDAVGKGVAPALDAAEGAGLIDRDRVHLFGQSAGGWAVMALLATTDHFRSGISMAGISDVAGYDTQPDPRERYRSEVTRTRHGARMGPTILGIEAMPWQAPQRYLYNSPLYRSEAIQSPLLLMHGDLDYVSISQSEAMFMALKDQGKPVEFVRYWGEDHVYMSAANIRDAFGRIVEWLGRHDSR